MKAFHLRSIRSEGVSMSEHDLKALALAAIHAREEEDDVDEDDDDDDLDEDDDDLDDDDDLEDDDEEAEDE
jgi:hypothetical protein